MALRRAKGDGSLRKRPDGRWEGRYTVGTDYATGKRIQKSVFGKTQAEARDIPPGTGGVSAGSKARRSSGSVRGRWGP